MNMIYFILLFFAQLAFSSDHNKPWDCDYRYPYDLSIDLGEEQLKDGYSQLSQYYNQYYNQYYKDDYDSDSDQYDNPELKYPFHIYNEPFSLTLTPEKNTFQQQSENIKPVNIKPVNTIKKPRAHKKNYEKMTAEIFHKMLQYEKENRGVKQCDLQKIFNINRSTYWRWKKKYNLI